MDLVRRYRSQSFFRDLPLGVRNSRIGFALGKYHSFAEIINYLNSLAINYPDRVRVQPIGTTHEGRQIPLIKVWREFYAVKEELLNDFHELIGV